MFQSTAHFLMVRPSAFGYNADTAVDNVFQSAASDEAGVVVRTAQEEFDGMVKVLRAKGVIVHVWEEPVEDKLPDAVFPNNWFSAHSSGAMIYYPLKAPTRRGERRAGVRDFLLEEGFDIQSVLDFSSSERNGKFLEGTGSLVLDHINSLAFACCSERTDPALLVDWCATMNYRPVMFTAYTRSGIDEHPIYHTNVMLAIGTTWALICPEVIRDADERAAVLNALEGSGRAVILLSEKQVWEYCGNALEVASAEGDKLIVMSERAVRALDEMQVERLLHHAEIVPVRIDTIERIGGGSARCMLAELFFPMRNK